MMKNNSLIRSRKENRYSVFLRCLQILFSERLDVITGMSVTDFTTVGHVAIVSFSSFTVFGMYSVVWFDVIPHLD